MTMNTAQVLAAQRIGLVLLQTIEEQGALGAPKGVMYAALMAHGCTLSQFQSIVSTMVRNELVTDEGDCLSITQKGQGFIKILEAKFAKLAAQAAAA